MTFSGVEGAPAQSFPEPPYTTLDTTPVSREKPFLYLDGDDYKVFVPAKRTNARGVSWNGTPQGPSIPLGQFYVVKPGATAQTINAALAQGLHLLFTPGVYHVDQPIEIDRANTVALGLGLATIIPDNGVTAIKVGDVDGVKLAGLLVDAGTQNSSVLVQVGPEGSSADHAANPTSLQDVFVRVGGAGAGKATTGMVVNSDDTIIDHTWLWRADHGDGVGWETNRSDYGLRVNGDDVLATGLFVEHFNKYDVQWYGENGKTIFFQNEKAYDAPNQAAIQNGDTKGYAAYKVADTVTTHEGWGMGSYCYFNVDPTIRQQHGFQAPVKPGVKFHDLLVVSLGGQGQYEHVINNTGSPTSGTTTVPSQVVSFPRNGGVLPLVPVVPRGLHPQSGVGTGPGRERGRAPRRSNTVPLEAPRCSVPFPSQHAELVALRIGHHHVVGAPPESVLADHGPAGRLQPLHRLGHPRPPRLPRGLAPPPACTSRCRRFFAVFGSGTFWKDRLDPVPSGSDR